MLHTDKIQGKESRELLSEKTTIIHTPLKRLHI